jgi:hypothetical protein
MPPNKPLKLSAASFSRAGVVLGTSRGSVRARPQLSGHPLGGGSECRPF